MTPRVLFVARTRYGLPLTESLQRRFDALDGVLDWRVLGTSAAGPPLEDGRFHLVRRLDRVDGPAFYAALVPRVVSELRTFRPDVVVAQGAADTALVLAARRLARSQARVVFDVHGDWRHDTRLYGSPVRRLLSPVHDRLAATALARADGIRTVSGFTTGLVRDAGREPAAVFPAYMDLEPFLSTPPVRLPARPQALFVGVLERYKAVDVLAAAWPAVAAQVPDASLHIVGLGPLAPIVEELVAADGERVRWTRELPIEGVVAALDEATVLVLPSRREGMGRVLVEAFCRGRAVVGTAAGGIADLVVDGESGLLVPVEDVDALAAALARVLADAALAGRLGEGAHRAAAAWAATPEEFARRLRDLVDSVLGADA